MARNIELEERVVRFTVSCIHVCDEIQLSKIGGYNLVTQLFRSATSVAANYAEASQAESARDFIHKLKIVLKELRETRTWLRIAVDSRHVEYGVVSAQLVESDELTRIFTASVSTMQRRLAKS